MSLGDWSGCCTRCPSLAFTDVTSSTMSSKYSQLCYPIATIPWKWERERMLTMTCLLLRSTSSTDSFMENQWFYWIFPKLCTAKMCTQLPTLPLYGTKHHRYRFVVLGTTWEIWGEKWANLVGWVGGKYWLGLPCSLCVLGKWRLFAKDCGLFVQNR